MDMRKADAGMGGGRRGRRRKRRREGRKEDAGRCLFKTRTQHHRMVGNNYKPDDDIHRALLPKVFVLR